jgi:DNA-binding SARP family transcriptional activator/tetratricopeptide (TPR) repeat protein
MIDVRLLGPLRVVVDGHVVDLGPRKQRVVLAALLVDLGQPVPTETLIERVWDGQAPAGARSGLYSYLTRLRRVLRQVSDRNGQPVELSSERGGYVLGVEPSVVDLHRFDHLLQRARAATGADRTALQREAMQLWRGDALADLGGGWAGRQRDVLEGRRVDGLLQWARAELDLLVGQHDDAPPASLLASLRDAVARHPLVEPLVAALMEVLRHGGRGAEALDLYAETRRYLAEELGTDPGPELRRLHQAILRGGLPPPRPNATGAAPAPAAGPVRAAGDRLIMKGRSGDVPAPAQLPRDLPGFAGRSVDLRELDRTLWAVDGAPNSAPATDAATAARPVVVISGTAGIGKTTLAVHWGHRMVAAFPDGQLFVNLRGFDPLGPALTPADALRTLLTGLGIAPRNLPAGLDAQAGLYRSLLAGRRVLVLLDNARDADQVRPLLPGAPGAAVVITSRVTLSSLVVTDGARLIVVDLLSRADARHLLSLRIGPDRTAAEPAATSHIVDACAGLPLALAIAAARAVTRPRLSLSSLAEELREGAAGLGPFVGDDTAADIRVAFALSYRELNASARRLFRLLGRHPGPDVTVAGAASLAGVPLGPAGTDLAELERAHLVAPAAPGRLATHDLLRAYASELATVEDSESDRQAALHRLLDYYLHSAHAAAQLLTPGRVPLALGPPVAGASPDVPADADAALGWLAAEHESLVAAVRAAHSRGFDRHTWQLGWALAPYLDRRGHWHDWLAVQDLALRAAERLGEPATLAEAHRHLAGAQARLRCYADAEKHYRHALDLYGQVGDRAAAASINLNLGWLLSEQTRPAEALIYAEQALAIQRSLGNRRGEAYASNAVGWYLAVLGDHPAALEHCRRALELHTARGDTVGQADTWDSLGYVQHHRGQLTDAVTCYRHAVALFRQVQDRHNTARALEHLGDVHEAAGARPAAGEAWRESATILEELGDPDSVKIHAKLARLVGEGRADG